MASIPAGVVADRADRRLLLIGCDGVRLGAYVVFSLLMFSGRVTLIDIFAVAVLEGLCGSVSSLHRPVLSLVWCPTTRYPQRPRPTRLGMTGSNWQAPLSVECWARWGGPCRS